MVIGVVGVILGAGDLAGVHARTAMPDPTPTPTPTVSPTPTYNPVCQADAQCPPWAHCRASFCRFAWSCDDSDPAVSRFQCYFFVKEACVDRLCECPGDCDLDGYVHVNELNRAVRITMGEVPLARCRSADIDGDRTVTVNEVVQGITNLMKGCLQEGQP